MEDSFSQGEIIDKIKNISKIMFLVVGLGNPGKEFEKTRHNVGFRFLDYFAKEYQFPKFQKEKKFEAEISQKNLGKEKVILAKPQTYMNNSGKAVNLLSSYYQIPPEKIVVVQDELDLPLGKFKISKNRGSAGHKGIESIISTLATKNFTRIRIGIEKKEVLGKFTKEEEKILKTLFKDVKEALLKLLEGKR